MQVHTSGTGTYRHSFTVSLAGVGYQFVRGFAWADLTAGDIAFRFVTTHLESQSADLALAQAGELLDGPAGRSTSPVLVACDCNAAPGSAAYALLTERGRLTDVGPPEPTGTLGAAVNEPTAAALDSRLDLVLTRSTLLHRVQVRRAVRTGVDADSRDPGTGLWPSDHAGVAVTLRIG